ncbi:MAG: beta-ketoacyl synthase chain length factor [Bacteroidia bacterium]
MAIYINGSSCISPQNSFASADFFNEVEILGHGYFSAIEPEYKNHISAASLRRMSRILKMGVTTALCSLKEAQVEKPDAIVTGTAMGCFEDTDKFLRSIGDNSEQLLTPTSFIQSTHNTVAAQIALLTKCHGYNFTYTQQEHSFEDALLDAALYLEENPEATVLAGGLDELNQSLIDIFSRTKLVSKEYGMGEGAVFFTFSAKKQPACKSELVAVKTIHTADTAKEIVSFLNKEGLTPDHISCVLSGGETLIEELFPGSIITLYKKLCGEYFTSSAFAMWLGNKILSEQKLPMPTIEVRANSIRNLLIVNSSDNKKYSLILLKAV